MSTSATIHIDACSSTVIYTTWLATSTSADVTAAFQQLMTRLDNSRYEQHIVIDMSAKPLIPLVQTIAEVLSLSYHRRVAAWTIVGSGACAKSMADVLQKVCTDKPAYCFADAAGLCGIASTTAAAMEPTGQQEAQMPCRA